MLGDAQIGVSWGKGQGRKISEVGSQRWEGERSLRGRWGVVGRSWKSRCEGGKALEGNWGRGRAQEARAKDGGREAVVPGRHVPEDRRPRSRMGSRKGAGVHLPVMEGSGGLQRENGLRLGRGCLTPQSPPPSFPSSLPKLPGSPRLPRQPLLPGAVTKETPCPPLPPPHHWRAPPHPKQQRCGGWEGLWGRRTRTPAPERGTQTYLRSGDPHPKPTS